MRFLPIHLIPDLLPGLCLVLYDMLSGVTRVLAVEGRSLVRCADAFGILETNTPQIARALLTHGPDVLRLSRVGKDCTGFNIDVNAYTPAEKKKEDGEEDIHGGGSGKSSLSPLKHVKESGSRNYEPQEQHGNSTMAHLLVSEDKRPHTRYQGRKGARIDPRVHRLEMAKRRFREEIKNSL